MSTAAMTLRLRPRPRPGPALHRVRLPVFPIALSAIGHVLLIVAVLLAATVWRVSKPKTYIVNLVPAVAPVPSPQSRPTATERAAPAPPKPAPELPRREASRELPSRETAKELPPVSRSSAARDPVLPDRSQAPRTPAAPRPGDKELPTVARTPAPSRPAAPPTVSPPPAATPAPTPAAAPPAPPAGQPTGTTQGLGSLSLNVSDFPFTWYIQAVHRKIHEQWEGRAIQGRQPEVIFEIARDGKLKGLAVSKSSGNPAYDQFALRAVASASPFPPLPQGFEKSVLTIGLQFIYDVR
jgi:periplasmic protein TonB